MIISTHGARFYGGQIDRIDNGLRELGHLVNVDQYNVDLIYCNDESHYSDAIYTKTYNKHAKLILNVLDVPTFIPEWAKIAPEWRSRLLLSDKVTSISKFTQNSLKESLGMDSICIYNPVKKVYS